MKLRNAARYFDRAVCIDAYNPAVSFKGQLGLFDDSMRDGTTVVRRVLSVDQDVVLPARRAVEIHGEVFLIGGLHNDSFNGAVIRAKYVLHRADELALTKTADQVLRTLAGGSLYAAKLWVKDLKEIESSSRLSSFVNIYAAPTESIAVGSFVYLQGRWHLVRNTFKGAAGFLVCEADEMPADAVGSATYTSRAAGTYNPSTDAVSGSSATVPVLSHRWQDDYRYLHQSAVRFDDGDVVAHVSKASVATAAAGDSFVLSSVTYRVLSARDDNANAWTLHCRRD